MILKRNFLSIFCYLSMTALLSVSAAITAAENVVSDEETAAVNYRTYAQGLFEVSAYHFPDYVWDLKSCTVQEKENNELQLYHSLSVNQQKFYFENFAEDAWRISDVLSGQALTLSSDGASVFMSPMEHPEQGIASAAQTWSLQDAGNQSFFILSPDGNCLTRSSMRAFCGESLSLEPYSGRSSQKWVLNQTWIGTEDCADTDLINPYAEDGAYSNLRLVLDFPGGKETLTASMLAEHMTETENHELILDPNYLPGLVEEFAAKYDTQQNSRRFITTAGNEINISVGNYGWKLNKEETLTLIQSYLQTSRVRTIQPVWTHKVTKLGNDNGINDMGDSYVEVDVGTQKVWLYHYGELLLESDCVTGTYHYTDTVQGAYAIFLKQSPATLTGPGYSSPVDFWMPFYNGYGLHNASWRGSFGGEIYKSNGSHGCVNMPYETAKKIYETVTVGYPVIVYSSIPGDETYH